MNEIKLLDKQTIDKIAAGEVVERPASIVKELTENSIDAGASSISVEIKDGGISLIRITDNGSGIPSDQVAIAFQRHSTSKIRNAADLSFIHSLGFRGEALSSISAVSRTELCTKTADTLTGTIYIIEGGKEISLKEAGLPDGTTILVRDLFFNTPARKKFLKSAQTEAGYVMDVIQHLALSHPDISFKYTANGIVRLNTPGNGSLKDTVYSLFGRDISRNMLEIHESCEILAVDGFIGKPEIARGNRNFELYFVNHRFVRDRIIQRALEEAYTGYQMKGSFPFCVFNIQMEPELVDVNVHPAKREVRFFNGEQVFNALHEIIRERIVHRESIPKLSWNEHARPAAGAETPDRRIYIPEPFETKAAEQFYHTEPKTAPVLREEPAYAVPEAAPVLREDPSYTVPETVPEKKTEQPVFEQQELPEEIFISPASRKQHRIVGAVFDTYWIVQMKDKMFIIDQHAAHEKVLYERFMKRLGEGQHHSQQILPAMVLTLSVREESLFRQYQEQFAQLGFEAESFGGSEIVIKAVPTDFYSLDPKILFLEMLNDLSEISGPREPETLKDRVATAACKAAVKGGNKLSVTEAEHLIDELLELDNPYNCPHGRPTIISMSQYELEKKFKRVI